MNGVWNSLCLKFVHEAHGLDKMSKDSKEVLNNLVAFSKKLELYLKDDDFT